MAILYAPDGSPYEVPHAEIDSFLRRGFYRQNPQTSQPPPKKEIQPGNVDFTQSGGVSGSGAVPFTPQKQATDLLPDGSIERALSTVEGVKINSASLKELTGLPGVSTAVARKIVENRPYKSPEDLIALVDLPSGDWLAIADKITF